jgi:NADH-quinone oxidoreductase subunit L
LLWIVGVITAGMTAFYMFRLFNLTFRGTSRVPHEVEHHIHESPASMTVPLMLLAALSIIGGWIGWPTALGGSDHFAHFLDPVIARHAEVVAAPAEPGLHTGELALMLLSVLVALSGIGLAHYLYLSRPELPERISKRSGFIHQLLLSKYYVDELYDALFVNRAKDLGLALGAFDRTIINGVGVDGAGLLTRALSVISAWWDKWFVDGLVNLVARIVWILSTPVRMLETGRFSTYAVWIVVGVLLFLGYYLHLTGVTLHSVLHIGAVLP